jgi:NACHT domain
VLRQITIWADGPREKCIFWLNGMAGTGKSTIARTVARRYYDLGRLGASFFFSRGGGDLSHAGKFFTSIAAQLANKSPALKGYIREVIAEHKDIADQALRDQWKQLVFRPLSMLMADEPLPPLVLVVDALDECEHEDDVRAILLLLAEARCLGGIRLRVLVTSRPETPIRLGFRDISRAEHQDFVLHNISQSVIGHDLTAFVHHELAIIRRKHGFTSDWPGEQITKLLVQKAGGLFIWAATACRFIGDGKRFAKSRLSLILQGDTSGMPTERRLDEIYLAILMHSIRGEYGEPEKEELYRMFKQTVGSIIITFEAPSADTLAKLLDTSKEEIDQTLYDLHSLLNIPEDQEQPIRPLHPSFRDFLLDKRRCWDPHFWVDEKKTHGVLARSCLWVMFNGLRRDICGLHAPGALASKVHSNRIQQCLPSELQYACRYWIQHLQCSKARLFDNDPVHRFLQKHFLHWLEALSLIGKTSDSVGMVTALQSMMVSDPMSQLHYYRY